MIFYFAVLLMLGCVVEIYVRMKGMGVKVEKDRKGLVIPYKPRLALPALLGLAAMITAFVTY